MLFVLRHVSPMGVEFHFDGGATAVNFGAVECGGERPGGEAFLFYTLPGPHEAGV